MKTSLRVLVIGFSWMLIWAAVSFAVVCAITDRRSHGAVSAIVGATLVSAVLGLVTGLAFRSVIEISSRKDQPRRRLRSDLVLAIVVYVVLILALALVAYIRKLTSSGA